MARKPCRNGSNCRNQPHCRFQHQPPQSQCDVQVGPLLILHIYTTHSSASFPTYLEAAPDQTVPTSTRTDQLKQLMDQENFFTTDFKEADQGPQEKTTGVLRTSTQRTDHLEEPMDQAVPVSSEEAPQDLQEKMTKVLLNID